MFEALDPIEITVPGPVLPPRVTTPLRTVIDIAPRVTRDHLARMVEDCLERGLFTVDEAIARIEALDMADVPGALLLRRILQAM